MAIEDTLAQLEQAAQQANLANEKRYAQAMAIYDEIISRYQPGGEFGKAALGELELQKKRDVAAETQNLISSGLYGTTTATGLPSRWESQVGAPARLKLEDLMMERLSGAQQNKASFIERREDVGPSYETIANLAAQASQGTTSGGYTGGGGGLSANQQLRQQRFEKELAEINAKYSGSSSSYPSYSSSSYSSTPTSKGEAWGDKMLGVNVPYPEEAGTEEYGYRTAPTIEAPTATETATKLLSGGWLNMISGERRKTRPEPFNPASAWVYMSNLKI